ncbi:hypothetical protein ACQP2E_18370 [Actinoplanes sp. CA-015351]|uniref:hypothetical protein n=1 Tax=Actinoplanes sp. CA-015351 TaxID=3239897 RepID=UPI003D99F898
MHGPSRPRRASRSPGGSGCGRGGPARRTGQFGYGSAVAVLVTAGPVARRVIRVTAAVDVASAQAAGGDPVSGMPYGIGVG